MLLQMAEARVSDFTEGAFVNALYILYRAQWHTRIDGFVLFHMPFPPITGCKDVGMLAIGTPSLVCIRIFGYGLWKVR